jgi:CheY-like chemotaxis protein
VPHKLLLADDSVTIQRVIELTFADEDVQVVAVGDGDQAIARLDAEPPDIVLVDVGMPGKNGYEVAAYMKHTPRLAHIPVLLLTGASEPVDRARADSLRCDGVLAKPFEPQLVIGRVKELLGRRGRPAPPADGKAAAPAASGGAPNAAELDGYFDRLDAAFATMSSGRPANAPPLDLPLSHAAAAAQVDPAGGPSRAASRDERAPGPPAAPSAAATSKPGLPPLADAFAAILAAEQAGPASPAAAWPATVTIGAVVTEDLIEQVTRRVLERLSDRIVRETAAEIVTAVAERLVREEIEKLKSAIK